MLQHELAKNELFEVDNLASIYVGNFDELVMTKIIANINHP